MDFLGIGQYIAILDIHYFNFYNFIAQFEKLSFTYYFALKNFERRGCVQQ